MLTRQIAHLDLDAFFASVEELQNPALRDKPVIVGGSPRGRGVVSSASYPARQYGVHSAMPTARALRLCPDAILIHPSHSLYGEYSQRVMSLLAEYTPLMEQLSIDEAFLDVTSTCGRWGSAQEMAWELQGRIQQEIGLSASLGIATNKLVAKIASALEKPHGLVVVKPGQEAAFLSPLPIERLWGVGPATAGQLHGLGVRTIGQLAGLPAGYLEQRFGEHGRALARHARGLDDRPVEPEETRKSFSQENTFAQDVSDPQRVDRELLRLSERVARRLRRRGLFARTVKIKLRWEDFTTLTRQRTLSQPTNLEQVLYEQGRELLHRAWLRERKIRLIGIGASNLTTVGHQLGLFGPDHSERLTRLVKAVDDIRDRFGEKAIQRASLLQVTGKQPTETPG
jgi:DNA polymerase-4